MAILPSGIILGRLTSLCQEGLLFPSCCPPSHSPPRPFSPPRSPVLSGLVPISLTAARRHSAPCGCCGKNPRRTRINAIMNLSRWDLTIQDVATTPPPSFPIRNDVLRHPANPPLHVYTKTNSGFCGRKEPRATITLRLSRESLNEVWHRASGIL